MNTKLSITFLSALIALNIVGCGDKSGASQSEGLSRTSTSLKPQSQLDFEKELKSAQARVDSSGQPGTRAYEEAKAALDNFWSNKQATMTRVDGWVCMYTNAYKWEPEKNISSEYKNEYELMGDFCTDADKPYKSGEFARGGKTGFKILIENAKGIEPLYAGDVIAISGKPFNLSGDINNSYRIGVQADSIKVIKKGN